MRNRVQDLVHMSIRTRFQCESHSTPESVYISVALYIILNSGIHAGKHSQKFKSRMLESVKYVGKLETARTLWKLCGDHFYQFCPSCLTLGPKDRILTNIGVQITVIGIKCPAAQCPDLMRFTAAAKFTLPEMSVNGAFGHYTITAPNDNFSSSFSVPWQLLHVSAFVFIFESMGSLTKCCQCT